MSEIIKWPAPPEGFELVRDRGHIITARDLIFSWVHGADWCVASGLLGDTVGYALSNRGGSARYYVARRIPAGSAQSALVKVRFMAFLSAQRILVDNLELLAETIMGKKEWAAARKKANARNAFKRRKARK